MTIGPSGETIELDSAKIAWASAARPILEDVAKTYNGYITYGELAEKVQEATGIKTRVLIQNWIGEVALLCQEPDQPLLSALVVRKRDKKVGSGYLIAVDEIYPNEAVQDLQEHAARERLRCYEFFGAIIPEDVDQKVQREHSRRMKLWEKLEAGDLTSISPKTLNDLRIYRGQAGIYSDKIETGLLTDDDTGVAVSVLHSGLHYPDDVDPEGLLCHYPQTERSPAHDKGEIAALKNARLFGLPVFTIIRHNDKREVRLSWVEGWDDDQKVFLIVHGGTAPAVEPVDEIDTTKFVPTTQQGPSVTTNRNSRPGQQRFKFKVEGRYGQHCAVCNWDVENVLEAAHIIAKADNGTDDPRNGLPLCPNHHRSFDALLWGIDPASHKIVTRDSGPSILA